MEDLISIIIPVYNVEKYLKYCLESLLNQTYKNLEIILVDDGSTDSSPEICDKYKQKDSRIKVIHKKNGGAADARNCGLKEATGKYIAFLDGDDCIKLNFYEYLKKLIESGEYDIAECEFLRIPAEKIADAEAILCDANNSIEQEIIKQNRKEALEDLYGFYLEPYVNKVVLWNKLYKKELFENIEFQSGRLHEDEFLLFRIFDRINNMIVTNLKMNAYIQSPNSMMRRKITFKQVIDNLDAYKEAIQYFDNEVEIKSNCVRRYLENCVELTYKIENFSQNENQKNEMFNYVKISFKKYYEEYMDFLNKFTVNDERKEIIELLEEIYGKLINNEWNITELCQYYKYISEKESKKI